MRHGDGAQHGVIGVVGVVVIVVFAFDDELQDVGVGADGVFEPVGRGEERSEELVKDQGGGVSGASRAAQVVADVLAEIDCGVPVSVVAFLVVGVMVAVGEFGVDEAAPGADDDFLWPEFLRFPRTPKLFEEPLGNC